MEEKNKLAKANRKKEKARVEMVNGVILVKWSGLMSRVNTEGRIESGEGGKEEREGEGYEYE